MRDRRKVNRSRLVSEVEGADHSNPGRVNIPALALYPIRQKRFSLLGRESKEPFERY